MAVLSITLALLASTPNPIDAYLAPASPGEVVRWENHRRRVFKGGACVAECEELDLGGEAFVPNEQLTLVVVDVASQRARVLSRGKTVLEARVAFGQAQGAKQQQGDNKTPRGRYVVTDKHRGEFSGRFGAYYGGHWVKISYPNAVDARRGRRRDLVSAVDVQAIERAERAGALSPQNTKLGGGIGFHGWIEEWDNPPDGAAPLGLSWGCVVLHVADVARFYQLVPVGAVVVVRD
jgi:hypothetical protein